MTTKKGFKLFEQNANGDLFPLFINKNIPTPMNEWIEAENKPTKGFAARPGWHISMDTPDAPWLKDANGNYKSRFKNGKRVWCEVEYDATNDYREEALRQPKKCFTDKIPEHGYYWFKEGSRGTWVITSAIKVTRIISEEERQDILVQMNYNEDAAYAPYKAAMEKRMKKAV